MNTFSQGGIGGIAPDGDWRLNLDALLMLSRFARFARPATWCHISRPGHSIAAALTRALITALALCMPAVHAQETTTVIVDMPCGVAGTPACNVAIDAASVPSPALSASEASITADFSIINIAAPSLTFAFPFQRNATCSQPAKTAQLTGRTVSLSVDYCKAVGVFTDVMSFLAYVTTAGYLIHLAFKPPAKG